MKRDLEKSYKGRFPFRIGTTSFIYPADYLPNVRRLGPYLDEIELLFFDSAYEGALPSRATIGELARLAKDLDLTYNIHLPTDVFLGHEEKSVRRKAVDTLRRVIEQSALLKPTTMTLHLPVSPDAGLGPDTAPWQDRLREDLGKLIAGGVEAKRISVETLDYPFAWVEGIVADLGLSVCLDLGHLLVYGYDMQALYGRHRDRVSILHVHGVAGKRDHISLDRTPAQPMAEMMAVVSGFSGTVSLEVFSFDHLASSIACLANQVNGSTGAISK